MSYSEFASMPAGEFLFVAICILAITVICYCTIPTILRFTLIKKRALSKGKIIVIAVTNSILVFSIIQVLTYDGDGISLYPAIIWGIVNYFILNSGNAKFHISNKGSNGNKFSAGSSTYTYAPQEAIAPNTKDTIATPKRHTKTLPVILVCLCTALAISTTAVSYYAYTTISHQNARIEKLKEACENSSLYGFAAIQYMETAVVVKDGDNEYYHRMNCPQLGVDYEYLVFNIEAAKGRGYSECPICFELNTDDYIKTYF